MVAPGESDELLAALADRSGEEELELGLLIRAAGDAEEDARRLRVMLARLRASGLYVRDATLARGDPAEAAARSARTCESEEVLLAAPHRRLGRGPGALAERIGAATGLPVGVMAVAPTPRTPARTSRERMPRDRSQRLMAARLAAAAGLALLALAAASAAVDDEPPPKAEPVEPAPAPLR